jgi:hypothetical protein
MSTPQKIAELVSIYCNNAVPRRNLGTVVEFTPGAYRVEADGKTVIVFKKFSWWHVRFKSVEVKDYDLAKAARLALQAGAKVEVSKHVDLAAEMGLTK